MRPVRSAFVMAALVLAPVLAAGCAGGRTSVGDPGQGSESGPAMDNPAPSAGGVPCTATDPFIPDPGAAGPTPTPLAAAFVPVEATRCVFNHESVPGDGEWLVRVEQRAGGDLSALATQLRRPDETQPPGMACTLIAYLPIIITLVDGSGATTVPAIPREGCSGPQRGSVEAIEALSWQTVKETRIRQTRSELEVGSGCSGACEPVVALTAAAGGEGLGVGAGVSGPVYTTPPTALQVCRYEIDRTQASVNMNGVDFGLGVLKSAGTLEGTALTQFLAALDNAPAAATCGESQEPFAIVFPTGEGGRYVGIELGGCYRYMADTGGLRQLDAATVALLTP